MGTSGTESCEDSIQALTSTTSTRIESHHTNIFVTKVFPSSFRQSKLLIHINEFRWRHRCLVDSVSISLLSLMYIYFTCLVGIYRHDRVINTLSLSKYPPR